MTKKIMLLLAFSILLFDSTSSNAECNSICRRKCAATAALAGNTVAECIQKWSYINAKYGRRAKKFEYGANWNQDLCRLQCRISWQRRGFTSVDACIKKVPCSKFPQ